MYTVRLVHYSELPNALSREQVKRNCEVVRNYKNAAQTPLFYKQKMKLIKSIVVSSHVTFHEIITQAGLINTLMKLSEENKGTSWYDNLYQGGGRE